VVLVARSHLLVILATYPWKLLGFSISITHCRELLARSMPLDKSSPVISNVFLPSHIFIPLKYIAHSKSLVG
jgi:hypothetical protein